MHTTCERMKFLLLILLFLELSKFLAKSAFFIFIYLSNLIINLMSQYFIIFIFWFIFFTVILLLAYEYMRR